MPKTKLQKQLSRKVGNREYAKWVLVIPPSIIKELGWQEGANIQGRVEQDRLMLQREKKDGDG